MRRVVNYCRAMSGYDTIIVGLGAAGCQAASTLAQAGRRVLGLEAQERIGGRVHTVAFGEGVVEVGAEWIHGTVGSRVYEAAMSKKLELCDEHLTYKTFRSDGSTTQQELAFEVIHQVLNLGAEATGVPMPLGEFVVKYVQQYFSEKYPDLLKDEDFMSEFYQLLELIVNNLSATNSWNDSTTQSELGFLEGCVHVSWHQIGYRTLFDILLNKYNNGPGYPNLDIKLNTEVTHIQWPQDPNRKVHVTTKDGAVYTADNAIVTLSIGVLKECYPTLFSPKLPEDKIKAIEHISIGVMDKITMAFDEVWWKDDYMFALFLWKTDDKRKVGRKDYWTTKVLGVSSPKGSRNTITFWTSGEVAKTVEVMPEVEVKTKLMELLRKFLGSTFKSIPEPTDMIRSTWHANPYTRGSYTYDNVLSPQYPSARTDLSTPILDSAGKPRVLFAGEATEADHFSTVHGATNSGYREATRILDSQK